MSLIQLNPSIAALPSEVARTLRNTYILLAVSLIPTLIGSVLGAALLPLFVAHPILSTILLLGGSLGSMVLVRMNRNSSLGVLFLLLFTGVMGVGLGPMLSVHLRVPGGAVLVGLAAGMTLGVFAILSLITTVTKKDFGFFGNFLFAGLMILLIASIAGIFIVAPVFHLVLATVSALLFTGYLLYDLSEIIQSRETNYIMATMRLYLDLINLFVSLLRILDEFRR